MRTIAVSDIHAHPQTLKRLLEEQVQLTPEDNLFLLGDYVHRGPSDEAVFDYIINLQKRGFQIQGLYGNHEVMWLEEKRADGFRVPKAYNDFLSKLKFVIEHEDFIFVHAGLNFNKRKPLEDFESMLWIRDWHHNIDYDWLGNRTIIHGHTPMTEVEIRKRVADREQAIGIDNGCFVNFKDGMAQLCAFDLTNWKLYFQKNIG